jgi:hypothetical protein
LYGAQFSTEKEKLAFPVNGSLGEKGLPDSLYDCDNPFLII